MPTDIAYVEISPRRRAVLRPTRERNPGIANLGNGTDVDASRIDQCIAARTAPRTEHAEATPGSPIGNLIQEPKRDTKTNTTDPKMAELLGFLGAAVLASNTFMIIQDAHSGFCVLGGFFVERASVFHSRNL